MNIQTFINDAALAAGFLIVSCCGPSCIEVAGNGDWERLERACKQFVKHSKYDHVSVIVQSEDGSRELRDVGTCDLRNSRTAEQLPSVSYCKQVAGRTERTETLLGVYPSHGSYSARVQVGVRGRRKFIYLGLYKTRVEAAKVRDRYVIEHDVKTPLNFSGLLQGGLT
jgi:hypothetical protein